MLLSSFLITTVTCVVTAVTGYLMYGERVDSQITLNLPTTEASSKVAIYTTLFIPITRYALMLSPVASIIEGLLPQNYQNRRHIQSAIRLGLLLTTTIVAFVFPYFETLMGLVGSIFIVFASFLLPCSCYLKLTHSYSSLSYKLVVIVGIIVFGVLAGVLGTYTSIAELVKKYWKNKNNYCMVQID